MLVCRMPSVIAVRVEQTKNMAFLRTRHAQKLQQAEILKRTRYEASSDSTRAAIRVKAKAALYPDVHLTVRIGSLSHHFSVFQGVAQERYQIDMKVVGPRHRRVPMERKSPWDTRLRLSSAFFKH